MMGVVCAGDVLAFWFEEIEPVQWRTGNAAFDAVIRNRFGRYPHRNALLGWQSTPEEVDFLNQPGSSF